MAPEILETAATRKQTLSVMGEPSQHRMNSLICYAMRIPGMCKSRISLLQVRLTEFAKGLVYHVTPCTLDMDSSSPTHTPVYSGKYTPAVKGETGQTYQNALLD